MWYFKYRYGDLLWKYKNTPEVRSKILSKLIFASCVWYSDRAYHGLCVLIKDIDRRLPLQLQCIYHGQQGDVSESVRGNYKIKTRFWGGRNLIAVDTVQRTHATIAVALFGFVVFWMTGAT